MLKATLTWLHDNRTKVTGLAGVVLGAIQGTQGQGWRTMALGAAVAALGYYNDWANKTAVQS